MEIKIDESVLKEYVEKTVNAKVDALTDEIIKDKVHDALFDKVSGVFGCYGNEIKVCIDKHVREIIEAKIPALDKDLLVEVGESIASRIAYNLKESILSSISIRLQPYDEDEEDD